MPEAPPVITFGDLLGLKDIAFKIAELFFSHRDKLDKAHIDSREKVYLALSETKMYLADLRNGRGSREREKTLSSLWREASLSLRNIDHTLADRCFIKMDYWADPETWSDQDIEKAEIGFQKVFDKVRESFDSCDK